MGGTRGKVCLRNVELKSLTGFLKCRAVWSLNYGNVLLEFIRGICMRSTVPDHYSSPEEAVTSKR